MRLEDDDSFKQVPQEDGSILVELQQKFGLKTGWDDQLDTICEKVVDEEERVDANEATTQAKQRTKKRMDAPLSQVAPVQQRPPPTLVAPKATIVITNFTKRPIVKKQTQKPLLLQREGSTFKIEGFQ